MQTLVPITIDHDPRSIMTGTDLALATQNHFPVVANEKRVRDRGMVYGVAGALALGAITLYSLSTARQEPTVKSATEVAEKPAAQPMMIPPGAETIVPQNQPTPTALAPVPPVLPMQQMNVAPIQNDAAQRAQSPTVILDSYAPQPAPIPKANGGEAAAGAGAKGMPNGLSTDESFSWRVGESGVDRAKASALTNPSTTVVQGTLIAAVLETGVNSDLPGYVRAFVSQDVRSFDNKYVLIPRGSRLIGQYKSGVAAGQTRVLVAWSRLMRPDGVSVALASPGTDLAGETGLPGDVNSHFMKRFGAAMLLSIVGGVASSGAGTVIVSGASSAGAIAAQSNANIPPTIRVAQGQPIRIFTARDLDFSGVTATRGGQ